MSFDTRAGTRGGWQPGTGGPIGRWLTKRAVNRIRRTGKAIGFDALVLTTIGRKTGVERTTPVGRFPGKDGSWLIVASAAGGPRHPAWYYNLAAHPEKVQIEMAVSEPFVEPTIQAIIAAARTDQVGDGKIFVQPLDGVIRIRTGERDNAALTPVTADEVQRAAQVAAGDAA